MRIIIPQALLRMERVSALTAPLYEFGRSTASSAEKRTREQPLPTLAAAAAGGLLTGYLVSITIVYNEP